MKITVIIMMVTLMQVSAATFGQKVTLKENRISLDRVFKEMMKQTGYDIFLSAKNINLSTKINVDLNNVPLAEAIEKVLAGLPLTYSIEEKTVVVKEIERSILAKMADYFSNIDVSGRVVDENGNPIAGATVKVKGTGVGTSTNETGFFMLRNVDEKGMLEVSYLGYQTRELKVAVDLVTVRLEVEVGKLEEVTINAGYYKVKERELTGSIARITSKDIENQPVGNVLSTMQGRMAGVNIVQSGGNAGGGFDVQIRGRNSLRNIINSAIDGNQALYILDGVPMPSSASSPLSSLILPLNNISPLNGLNVNDIETIEVLKDADATAIYGSRGANGVVLITTKKGKRAGTEFSLNSSYALGQVASKMKMMNTQEYVSMRKVAYTNDGIINYPVTAYDVNGAWNETNYTDWQKELIGSTANTSNNSLGISGGDQEWSYRINASHNEQTTVYPTDYKYKNSALSTVLTHQSKDKKMGFSLSNNYSQQFNNVINEDLTNLSLFLSPNAPSLFKEDGSLNWQNNTFTNPMAATLATYQNDTKQFSNSVNISYQLLPKITFGINSGFNYQSFEEFNVQPHTRYNPAFGFTSATGSNTSMSSYSSFLYNVEPQLNGNYDFGRSKLSFLFGGTLQGSQSKHSSIRGSGFESNALMMNINAARTKTFSDIISTDYKYLAFFGRFNYQFDQRYIINLTARRDGSSRFGPNNRFANFGAVGAAWLLSNESFMKDLTWLSSGKLRTSYGITGSDNIGNAQFLDTYSVAASTIYNGVVGMVPTRLFNGDFSWEKTKKFELAIELGFLQNNLNLNVSWYKNRSSNQLVGVPLAATTGFTSVQANLPATVENKGWEFELHTRPIQTKVFSWQSDLNLTIPKNRLLSFPGLAASTYANQYVVGASTSIVKLYQLIGINPSNGAYAFTDVDGDGKISSPNDNRYIEDLSVKFYGGWSNRIQYKNVDLSFLFQFNKQRNYNYHSYMSVAGTMNNQPTELLDVWSAQHTNGYYMPYSTGVNAVKNAAHSNFMRSTAAVGDASFIRLKNIQLNYRLKLEKIPIKNILLYVQGQNVLTLTKYFGLDPEFVVTGFLPPLKTWSFGTQINF